jgi:mannose-6-phosphate isomerase-like protein (cupin superfamily)
MKARIVRRDGSGWSDIPVAGYAPGQPGNVERHTLVGERRTDASAAGPKLELRYFRLAAGGASRLEKHEHEHYVIVGEGRGKVYVDGEVSDLTPHDVVYVAPMQPHQFVNMTDEPFGFYCIVSTVRDFYSELSEDEHAAIAENAAADFVQPAAQRVAPSPA